MKKTTLSRVLLGLLFLGLYTQMGWAENAPIINEFVFNHTGTDNYEYVEIYGAPNTGYSAYTILEIEGDSGGPGVIDGIYPVGTTDANGFWTTGFLYSELENGSVTLLLVRNFTGSLGEDIDQDNDGVIDHAPWESVVDSVAVSDDGAGDLVYSDTVLNPFYDGTAYTPGGASRIPDGLDTGSVIDWVRNDFDGAGLPGFPGTPDPYEALNTPSAPNQLAVPPPPVINEFVYNHTGTDEYEYVEIYGNPNTDYSTYTILEIEGDSTGVGAIDGIYPVGTTDANGFWTTGFLYSELENGSVTLLLVRNFTGSLGEDIDQDNDGVIDHAPWESVVDSVAVSDDGAGDLVYSDTVLNPFYDGTAYTPGGASRWPNGFDSDNSGDWIRNDFDGAGLPGFPGTLNPNEALNTPGAPNQLALTSPPVINEFVCSHTGTDDHEYVEIFGDPNTDYSAYTILEIEGDSTGPGVIDGIFPVGTTDVVGFWTTGFLTGQLENGTVTLLLVSNFSGSLGQDLDTDDDGILDSSPWNYILDSVGITDDGLGDRVYAETALSAGYDGMAFMPGGASRIPDGTDTGSVVDWVRNDFDGAGIPGLTGTPIIGEAINTPGSANQKVTGIVINEIDADTIGVDTAEFVELYDGGIGNVSLNGLVLVFYNGSMDASYQAFDLDGFVTNENGYFVVGNVLVPNVDLVFGDGILQNGPDAVALYFGNATDFPLGTPVSTTNLIDAMVYDTGDLEDPELLVLLHPGQPQVNEDGLGDKDNHSNQRCPNGSGGERNTETYVQAGPTPGAANNCGPEQLRIRDIQGAGHKSPYEGQTVATVPGIVTALKSNGFYMQDPEPDADPATSEGIFVYTSSSPTVSEGDAVVVGGTVLEYYPGGYTTGNLSITEITTPAVTVLSNGNPLPSIMVLGAEGRLPPSMIIEDDATGDVETTGTFDPAIDGIDFYESLEGMLVQVNDAVVVGPTSSYGEIPVVGDGGLYAGIANARGALVIRSNDFNPERIILDDAILALPNVAVGEQFSGGIIGVIDYDYGNFKLLVTGLPSTLVVTPSSETAPPRNPEELSVATFNVENLEPGDAPSNFQMLGVQIVSHLRTPDIIGLQEIQDNTGPTDDGVVDASITYTKLIEAIQAAGGPAYAFKDIPPVDGADGGEPGANIRVGFLYRPDRVGFVERPGGDAVSATDAIMGSSGVELSLSPGRIDPNNAAFVGSRKPLAGEFLFNDHKVFVIVNHFVSKDGDNPLFGRVQPPVLYSEPQRVQQAQAVYDFIQSILSLDSNAKVIVLGDLNDFQFSSPLTTLKGGLLSNLTDTLPEEERYTYIYEGNSEALDHILVSGSLMAASFQADVVHVNAEFLEAERPTDHDPMVAWFYLPFPCEYGIDPDGDVDGVDLAMYAASGVYSDLQSFAEDFGRVDCPQ